jgi:glycosyltransferase involved in cell wall biosynthesis
MTTLNSARFVAEAVRSILDQTYRNWEMIVVDGGSSDDTMKILKNYTDSRIHIYECAGLRRSAQLNYGFSFVSSPYIAIMDSDDIALPERLNIQYEYLEQHHNITIVGSWGERITEDGKYLGLMKTPRQHDAIMETLITPNLLLLSTTMFRNKLQNILFDIDIVKNVDIEWYFRISDHAIFACIDMPLVKIRETHGSLSRKDNTTNNKVLVAAFERQYKMRLAKAPSNNESYLINVACGVVHYYYGSQNRSRRFLWQALMIRKINFVVWRYYLPVVLLPNIVFKKLRKNTLAHKISEYCRTFIAR